jgi:hypothetical protein
MAIMTTQVKFSIDADIVASFKTRCLAAEVSMTSVIRRFMTDYTPVRDVTLKSLTHTRSLRKKTVIDIIGMLNNALESEADYRDSIPEQFTQRYETADQTSERLEEAISCLEEAY